MDIYTVVEKIESDIRLMEEIIRKILFYQIALLTDRIASLSGHLKGNVKDHSSRRGLMRMVNQRKRLLAYLAKTSPDRYSKLVKELNLKQ